MSVISGVANSMATSDAAQTAADAQNAGTAAQERMYNQTRTDNKPFYDMGVAAAPKLQSFDFGAGDAPSYDSTVTQGLSNYANDPGVNAQKQLGLKALAQQQQARGLAPSAASANAGAELSQKYDTTGYDRYKSDLTSKYTALQGEYAQRRDLKQQEYNQLLDQIKSGQGAAGSMGQANNAYANQAQGAAQNLGNIAMNTAAAQNANTAGAIGAGINGVGTGLKAYDYGQKAGWWGQGAAATSGVGNSYGVLASDAAPAAYEWSAAII